MALGLKGPVSFLFSGLQIPLLHSILDLGRSLPLVAHGHLHSFLKCTRDFPDNRMDLSHRTVLLQPDWHLLPMGFGNPLKGHLAVCWCWNRYRS